MNDEKFQTEGGGIFQGGPLHGSPVLKEIVNLNIRYWLVPPLNYLESDKLLMYERIKGTVVFKFVDSFSNFEELHIWESTHPQEEFK